MLKIRLRRMGSRHRPFYRVVVSDSRRVPTASALDEIGTYDPRRTPSEFSVDFERFDMWLSKGAQPSDTVRQLAKKARKGPSATEAATVEEAPKKAKEAPKAETTEEAVADASSEAAVDAAEDVATSDATSEATTEDESTPSEA